MNKHCPYYVRLALLSFNLFMLFKIKIVLELNLLKSEAFRDLI